MSKISIPASGLDVTITALADGLTVSATGEVDLFTVSLFEPPVLKVVSELIEGHDRRTMTIDLTNVEFIDSCGLAVLLRRPASLCAMPSTIST